MKEENNFLFDFDTPRRESPLAIVFIMGKTVYNIITRIWPALIIIFFRGKSEDSQTTYLLWGVIAVATIAMVFSFINYFKTYFFIKENELHLHKGVFEKIKTNIPFERIQTIHFEQNILHSIFNVVQLKMDTAGSEKTEIDFYAIEKERANALREIILRFKEGHKSDDKTAEEESSISIDKPILKLNLKELFKVGFTRNHLKSGGVIIVFLAWAYENIKELGVDADEYYEEILLPKSDLSFFIYLTLLFLLVSVIISLVRSVILFFDLKLLRVTNGFKMLSGLFTRKEVSALDHKIQMIGWSDNLLKKRLGFYDVRLQQAASDVLENREKILIPGMDINKIKDLVYAIFKTGIPEKSEGHNIQKPYFTRYFLITSAIVLMVCATLFFFSSRFIGPVVVIYGLMVYTRWLAYRKKTYVIKEGNFTLRGGAFGDKNVIFPMFKIQGLEVSQTPYQSKKGLANVRFNLASGSVELPYITIEEANSICDTCLLEMETTSKKWM